MYNAGDDIGAIVADIGSFAARVGHAGDDLPKSHLPSLLGVSLSSNKRDFHYDLSNFRQNISIESPLRDGIIYDWEMFDKLWELSLKNMRVEASESPVLMTEKPYNPPGVRQKTCELMFEKYNVPAFFLSKDAVLASYSLGRTSGLVIDIGANGTVITPVFDGWAEVKNLTRSIVGGRYLDAYVLSLLKSKGIDPLPLFRLIKTVTQDKRILVSQNPNIINVHPSYDALMRLEIGRDLKESTCRMADTTLYESDTRYMNIPMIPYELPDGTILDLGIERFQVPELLCDPLSQNSYLNDLALLGYGQPPQVRNCNMDCTVFYHTNFTTVLTYPATLESVPKLACDSILKCDLENHSTLLSNLVVVGGSSRFEGAPDRVRNDIERLMHSTAPSMKVKVMAAGPSERGLGAWLGGSILASLGSSHEMWMTKQEYAEYGSVLVDKKCP